MNLWIDFWEVDNQTYLIIIFAYMKTNLLSLCSFLLLTLLSQHVLAQSPFIFEKIEHDFGEIYETSGAVSAKFKFKNTGDKPLFISEVNVSCGCTTPEYSKDTLQPGDSSVIIARYDPAGRPGGFDKSIHIVFNNNRGFSTFIKIKGIVLSVVKPEKKKYSILYGSTSFSNTTFEFGEIKENREYTATIKIANDGLNVVKILGVQDLTKEFTLDFPKELKPGDSAILTLKTNKSDLAKLWGEFSYRIIFVTNDQLMGVKVLYIKGKTVQDFSHLSKSELANAPIIKVSSTNVNFGELKQGGLKTQTVTITNKGNSNLEIRNIHSGCYCFRGEVETKVIAPGETITLTLIFDSVGQKVGQMSRGITLYTNDPKNPELLVYGVIDIK